MLRYGIVAAFGLPHCCLNEDIKINVGDNDYMIYRGSTVMINHLAIHHNKQQYINGDMFDISRWLDKNNKFNKEYKINNFMVFGYASRDCIGQNIAMQEMYSVFILILNKYIVYNDDIDENYNIKRIWGITRDIKPEIAIYLKHRQK